MDARNATRNLALATLAFAVAFVGWSLIAPLWRSGSRTTSTSRTPARCADRRAGHPRLAAPDSGRHADRPLRRTADVPDRARRVGGPRRALRLRRRLLGAHRRRVPPRHRRLVLRGRRPVRRRVVPEGAAGVRARRVRDGERRDRGRGVQRPCDRRLARARGARDLRRGARSRRRRLLPDGRGPAARPRRPLRRGAALRLAAVPARVLLLRHVRRLRCHGGVPAEAAAATGSTSR